MDLKKQIFQKYSFTEAEWEKSFSCFESELFPAKSTFLQQGKISEKMGIITSGIMRSFVFDADGNEITTQFFRPISVVISIQSFNSQVPAKDNISALTDSNLLTITYEKMKMLWETIPAWKQIAKDVDEMKYQQLNNRLIRFKTLTASERYKLFCQNYPEIVREVALKHIASYLGIDIATLSRIRSKK